MATYRITAPDGGQYDITAPDDATQDQVLAYAQQNYKSAAQPAQESTGIGDSILSNLAMANPALFVAGRGLKTSGAQEGAIETAKQLRDLALGGIKGAGDIGATILHPFSSAERKQTKADIEGGLKLLGARPESLTYGAGETGAQVAGTAGIGGLLAKPFQALATTAPVMGRIGQAIESAGFNVAPSSTLAGKAGNALLRVGGGAITGGAATGLIEPENAKQGMLIGGAFGAASPMINKIIEKAVTKFSAPPSANMEAMASQASDDALKQISTELGINPAEIPDETVKLIQSEVTKAMQQGKTLDAAALLRQKEFEKLGMQPLQGQITREPTQFAQERNLRGVSPDISGRLSEQNAILQAKLGAPAAGAAEPYQAGNQLAGALKNYDIAQRGNVSSLYQAAKQSSGKDLEVPLQGMAQDVANVINDFGDKVPSGVLNNLKSFGLLGGKQTKLFTVEEADRLMKVINSNTSNDPAVNAALSKLRDSVRNSVNSVDAGGGVYAPAVQAAKQRFAQMDAIPALKAVAEGNATPDTFVNRFVIQGKTDEVKRLANLLKSQSPEAFGQAKSQMAAEIQRAAFGENITADAAIRPEMLAKKLRELGTEKMSAFFSPEEISNFQTASRVAAYIEKHPNAAPVNTSNTLVAQLMQSPAIRLAGKGAEMLPGAGMAVAAGKAMTGAVKNQMAVNQAMNAKVPTKAIELSESQRRLLAKVLGTTSAGATAQLAQ